ncbi:STAS domain-containing protein [Streptomyces longisporoflavus]|uniref:STAS domain-containing protein n=1 Tax=Streptomyces longisporoflavus TaxID=28044 RepID=UPI00167C7809|nr:STAS domain-containing protein [Streptomyces longisporoflavus]
MSEERMASSERARQVEQFSIVSTPLDDVTVLTLAGEIDLDTSVHVRQALEAVGAPGARVVIDLRRVTFIDSSGINVFIAGHRALTEVGGRLRLAGPAEPVARTLEIVGIDTLVDIFPTLGEALDS